MSASRPRASWGYTQPTLSMHECKPNAPRTYQIVLKISAEPMSQLAAHLLGRHGHDLGLRGAANSYCPIAFGSAVAGTTYAIAYAIPKHVCVYQRPETSSSNGTCNNLTSRGAICLARLQSGSDFCLTELKTSVHPSNHRTKGAQRTNRIANAWRRR